MNWNEIKQLVDDAEALSGGENYKSASEVVDNLIDLLEDRQVELEELIQ